MEFYPLRNAPAIPESVIDEYRMSNENSGTITRKITLFSPITLGCVILGLLLIFVIAGNGLASYVPSKINAGPRLSAPDKIYWFGTDALGRDQFSRVVHGFEISLWISLAATLIASITGILLGLMAGFYRGWVDQIFSRMIDVLLSLPGLLLAIVLIARLGPSMHTLIIAMGITGIPAFYRVTRVETLSKSSQPYIETGRSIGLSNLQLIFRHILPNIFSTLLALISLRLAIFLLMGSGLSFIGLGVKPPQVELGALLAQGKEYTQSAYWLVLFPGCAIILTAVGFNLFGEGLRDQLEKYE